MNDDRFTREIRSAVHNARLGGYDELRIDVRRETITPIVRGRMVRVTAKSHVTITRLVDNNRLDS